MVWRITALLVALSLLAAGESYAAPDAGSVRFMRGAERMFDPFTQAPSPEQQAWMREHYARMRTYAPYFHERLRWYGNAWTYKDAYAVYPGSDLPSGADRFILRDRDGPRLHIPFQCANGSCPQFAGDIGDPAFRAAWIEEAREQLAPGYRGLYVDDVNSFMQVSDGSGELVAPHDPRTGETMTPEDWQEYMADFMHEVRAAFPHLEIVHNSVWFAGDEDPDVARQLGAADVVNIERGINDAGLTGGTGRFALRTMLAMIDRLHARGIDVAFDSSARTDEERLYGLAGYFLVSNGRDLLGSYAGGFPDDWWSGYDVRLGSPEGPRYDWQGLLRRDFFGGVALLNEPGAPTRTVELGPGYRDLHSKPATQVTLGPASGAVLVREHVGPAAIWAGTVAAAARHVL
jgi:Hypothetical glycosyl hydrolase family 15